MRHPVASPAVLAVSAGGLFLAASLGHADEGRRDTPDAVYEREVGCASIAAAAVADAGVMSSLTEKESANAGELVRITRRIALTSGAAIGLSAELVSARIASGTQKLLDHLAAAGDSPSRRKDEEGKLGRVLIACGLVAASEGKTGGR